MEGYVMFFIYGTVFLAGILVGDLIAPLLGRKVYDGVMHISADHDYDDAKISRKCDICNTVGHKNILRLKMFSKMSFPNGRIFGENIYLCRLNQLKR